MFQLKPLNISGKDVLPLIEGGKGVAISNGESAGAWAAAGGVGTFSAVNADSYDEQGKLIPIIYHGKTRKERHQELINYAINGGIEQARIAHKISNGKGRIHINVLWEMGGVEPILEGILSKTKGIIHGVTCGAGMPYKLSEICANHNIFYYPIVSSGRAFRILWKRAYSKNPEWLGGVVYEDPWLAGGHNGLSNSEDPLVPQRPYERVVALRKEMRAVGLDNTPIVMAGGVWRLDEWSDWLNNPELGPIAFQFGTRPLLTKESPISSMWKAKLLTLKDGEIFLNRFSPTGFYSSAVKNSFLEELDQRSKRQITYSSEKTDDLTEEFAIGVRKRVVYVTSSDKILADKWITEGFDTQIRTQDSTLIFVTQKKSEEILKDQVDCMGCLSSCKFSNWSQNEEGTTGKKADPRSFCIQKSLQDIAHGGSIDHNLMFAGHQAYRFGRDSFYDNGFIPTVGELVARIASGK